MDDKSKLLSLQALLEVTIDYLPAFEREYIEARCAALGITLKTIDQRLAEVSK